MRTLLIAFAALAACASAGAEDEQRPNEQPAQTEPEAQWVQRDGFVWFNDACGASQYQHLLGENLAGLHQAALPVHSNVVDRNNLMTLEFTPGQLNVVVNAAGSIVAIGCF